MENTFMREVVELHDKYMEVNLASGGASSVRRIWCRAHRSIQRASCCSSAVLWV